MIKVDKKGFTKKKSKKILQMEFSSNGKETIQQT